MAKLYKQQMLGILDTLNIAVPDYITMDQLQVERLVGLINEALETYDPLPTGNATVTDVLAPKTFSNATGTGLTGTCTFDADTSDGDAVAADLVEGKIAYVNGAQVVGTRKLTVYNVVRQLTGCTDSNVAAGILHGTECTGTLALSGGFTTLPVTIDVTVGAVPMTPGDDFTYDNTTGVYSILPAAVVGDITIAAVATA
jgi:hypothetical protein